MSSDYVLLLEAEKQDVDELGGENAGGGCHWIASYVPSAFRLAITIGAFDSHAPPGLGASRTPTQVPGRLATIFPT
jgi:hypothetical protein